jgi:GxxExxY protein
MNHISTTLTENQLSKIILDAAFKVHTKTGPGLLETVYEVVLAHELRKQGLRVERQVAIPITYEDLAFEEGFRADLLVEGKVIVELKSLEELHRVHNKQVLTQLRLGNYRLGLLINFGEAHLKNGIERIVNGLPDDSSKASNSGSILSSVLSWVFLTFAPFAAFA